jgi:hypothetical protein
MAATTGTVAGRPQPQTTAEPAGGPFIRHAPSGRRAMYTIASAGFSSLIANPMVSSPGWNQGYRILFDSAPNAGTGGVFGTDAPYSYSQLVQMKDAFGTQLLTGPGFATTYLVQKYGGQFGIDLTRSPANLPSYGSLHAFAAATGAGTWATYLPFEFAQGYGTISGANAALLPVLQINTSPIAGGVQNFLSTTTTVAPTVQVTVDSDFYWLPNVAADPPGVGTTCQWVYQPCNPTIPSGGSLFVQLPRLGGYLTGIISELRDSTGVRLEAYPTRPRFLIDGVPILDTLDNTLQDDIAIQTGVGAKTNGVIGASAAAGAASDPLDTGVRYLSYKTSMAQREFGLLDTGEVFLSTNPGTQIEIGGFPWGTGGTAPYTLNVLAGQVVPSGALVRGLPEA